MKRGAVIAIMAAGVTLALGSGGLIASAQQVVISGNTASLADEQQALKEAKEEARRARAIYNQLEAQAGAATREADRLNAQAAALAARVQESEADLRAGQARIAIIRQLIERQSTHLAQQQGPLIRLTAALQSFSRRPPVLALLQPGSLRDTVHSRAALAHIQPIIQTRTAGLRTNLARTRQLQDMALTAASGLREAQGKLAEQRVALNRLEAQKRLAARGFSTSAAEEQERALAMSERARDIDALIGQMRQANAMRAKLAALPGPMLRPGTPEHPADKPSIPSGTAAYQLPATGTLVTGLGEMSDHGARSRGITLATSASAQVVAPAPGRIVFAGPYGGFGQILIIDHGDEWVTLITDLARLSVSVGQKIAQGEALGSTGAGAHPAITVELRRQGRPMDIIAIMNAGA